MIRKAGYGCSNYKPDHQGCSVYLSETLAGKKITPAIAKELFTNKKTKVLSGFISKQKGTKYSASLELKPDCSVDIVYENPVNPPKHSAVNQRTRVPAEPVQTTLVTFIIGKLRKRVQYGNDKRF